MSGTSNGPISTLPYTLRAAPAETQCDEVGCSTLATHRMQGETDSFGCEFIDLCEDHYLQHAKAMRDLKSPGQCDWCKQEADDRRPRRDYDEGMSGRVYQVCRPCIKKDNGELRRQQEEYDD